MRDLGSYNSKYHINDLYDSRIAELGQNIINPQQSLFHGTHAQRHILKEGFSLTPKATQAKSGACEIGKAVYLTPDKEVASLFVPADKTQNSIFKIRHLANREFFLNSSDASREFVLKVIETICGGGLYHEEGSRKSFNI